MSGTALSTFRTSHDFATPRVASSFICTWRFDMRSSTCKGKIFKWQQMKRDSSMIISRLKTSAPSFPRLRGFIFEDLKHTATISLWVPQRPCFVQVVILRSRARSLLLFLFLACAVWTWLSTRQLEKNGCERKDGVHDVEQSNESVSKRRNSAKVAILPSHKASSPPLSFSCIWRFDIDVLS